MYSRENNSPSEIVHKLLSDSRVEPLNLSGTFLSNAKVLFGSKNRERICVILLDFIHYLHGLNISEDQLIEVGNIAFEFLFKNSNEIRFCYTPKSIATLLTNLFPIDNDASVFDPTCGTGSFLLSAYKSVGSSTKLNLVGQEVNMRITEIATAYMSLNQIPTSTIKNTNSLIDTPNQKFDLVITEPPIGLRLSQDVFSFLQSQSNFQFGPPTRIADFNFIQKALASLNNSGRAAIMVNAGVLFRSGKEARIRERIIEEDLIEAVISLPQKSLSHTSSPPFIILFNKNKPDDRKNKILFIHASDDDGASNNGHGISSALIEKVTTAFETAKHEIGFSQIVSIEQVKTQGFQLIPIAYVDINKYAVFLGEKSRIEQLDQIAKISRGKDVPPKAKNGTEIRIINGRDLTTADLTLEKLEKRTISKIPDKAIFTQKDDVLLQRIGDTPTAFLVADCLEDVFISGTVFLIRLHKNKHRLGRYLVEFFNSKRGQDYLSHAKSHSMIPTMRILDLRRLEIPIPDDSVIDLLFDLYSIEQRLQSKIQVTGKLRNDLFNIEDENVFETELNTLVVQSQILNQSVSNVSDLFFQVRNFYPHMLAYSFRTVQSIQSPFELYKEQLRIAENILSFTGSVGLAIVGWIRKFEHLDFPLSKDDLLKYWQGGISPGDWFDIGKQCAKSLHRKTSHIALGAFPSLWFKGKGTRESEFSKLLRDSVTRKNDYKHDRGPKTEAEHAKQASEFQKSLDAMFRNLSFFVQYPMRFVLKTEIDWQSNITVETLSYVGDHPGLRLETVEVDNVLADKKLYLHINRSLWIPLYPVITVADCEQCNFRESYVIDALDSRRIRLKSYEKGHVHEKNHIAYETKNDFITWVSESFG